MPISQAIRNAMLDNQIAGTVYVSLHTGSPGETGTNEVAGGSPAYARKSATLGAAAAGVRTLSGVPLTFDVPAGTTVTHIGVWSAVSGGTFYGYYDATDETFAGQGQYQVTSGQLSVS